MEIINLKNRNIMVITPSLIQEIGCFVKVSIHKVTVKYLLIQIYLFFFNFKNLNES